MRATFSLPGRSREAELMDADTTDFATFAACLRDLERVNRASLGYRPTLRWLDAVTRKHRADGTPLTILDVGSGHGDMLRCIWRWATAARIPVTLTGIDLNPWSTRAAEAATPAGMPIRFETGDLFAIAPERRFDIILSALFAHHLSDEGLLRFVRWMEASARIGWFINDLHRHPVAEHGLRAIFAVLPVHHFVRHDGPVSVRRAFTRGELTSLLDAAAIPPGRATIRWHMPFRWGVGTVKP
jgi:hypothetical protein